MSTYAGMNLEAVGPKAALQLLRDQGVLFADSLKALDSTNALDHALLQNRLISSLHRKLNLAEAAPAASASTLASALASASARARPPAAASPEARTPSSAKRAHRPRRGTKRPLPQK